MVCNHSQGSQKNKRAAMLEQPKKVFSCSPVQSCDCKPPPVKDKVSMPPGPDHGCPGNACRQCVSPCERTFTSIPTCKKKCGNSKICQESCDFLGYLKSLPDVLDGNKSLTIKPGDPMATAKNLTSLTLSWKPTKSIGGSVVYVLKERFKGDFAERVKDMANLVFTEPRAVLDVRDICRYTPHSRRSWDGLQFLFKVVALTEYSQLVESTESAEIEPVRPEPVSSIGMPNMSYDASAFGDKLKLTTVVIPYKAQVSFISRYAMVWSSAYCDGSPAVIPRSAFSRGASTTIEMHIYEKLKLCKHSLQVYSLNQCIPSLPKTLTYEYKGCRFVSNFDRAFCYSFDPPPTPDSARSVGSLAHSPLQITRDFRVNTNITWLPPTFPYGKVQYYIYAYGDIKKKLFGLIWMATRGITKETSLNLENLLPNITVRVEINPSFPNAVGVRQTILFRTPGVPEDKIAVRYISAEDFQFSPANLFSVRLEWKKPLCDSNLYHGYRIKFVKGNDPAKTVNTSDTFCVIHSLGHQEPLVVMVKPVYGQDWIKPKDVVLNLQAPAPNVQDIVVRNLAIHNFTYHQHDNTFTAYFKWDAPSYRYRTIDYYQVGYTLIGGYTCPSNDVKTAKQCMPAKTVDSHYSIPGVPRQGHVVIWVKPVFKSSPFFEGIKNTLTVSPPNYDVWFCKEKPEGYYADVQDCKVFYRCDAHGKAYHLLCPARLYWNDNTTTCDLPHNVKCQKDYHSFCQGKSAGHYEDVQNHAAYYECDGKGRGFHFVCSDGLEWKQEIKACDLSTRQ